MSGIFHGRVSKRGTRFGRGVLFGSFGASAPPVGTPPTDVFLSASSVMETALPGSVVATISANGDAPWLFTKVGDPDAKFRIEGNNLVLDQPLDFETDTEHPVTIRAANAAGLHAKEFTISVTDVAEGVAPTDIFLSATAFDEDTAPGAIATISANGNPVSTFSIISDPDNKFDISGSNLILDGALDYETATSHEVTIRADNGVGAPHDQLFTINVNDIVEPPSGDITVNFGERTLEGAGGVAVTGNDFATGNEAGHFAIVNGDLVVSAAGVGNLSGPYNLVLNDGQTVSIPTIEPTTYSCKADGAEIDAANVDHVLVQTTASTISIRGGVVTNLATDDAGPGFTDGRTWVNRDFSTKHLTVRSADPANRPEFWDWRALVQGSDGITLRELSFRQTAQANLVDNFTTSFVSDGGSTATNNIKLIGNDFKGRDIDMMLDWYALHGTAYLPDGFVLSSTKNVTLEDNTFEYLHIIGSAHTGGNFSAQRNNGKNCYYDLYNLVGRDNETSDGGTKIIKDNVGTVVFGARIAAGEGPHGDGWQLVYGWLTDAVVENNSIFMGRPGVDHNGDDQQTWFGSNNTGFARCVLRGNLFLGQSIHGVTLPKIEDCDLEYNTVMENNPLSPVGAGSKPTFNLGVSSAAGTINVRNNITGGPINLYNTGSATFNLSGNLVVTTTGSGGSELLANCFDGPYAPVDLAAALVAYTPLIGSPVADIGAVDTAGAFRTFSAASAPDQIGSGDFSVVTGSGPNELDVTIANAPADNGAAINDYEMDVNGSDTWASLGIATPGTATAVMAAPSTSYDIRVRAVNSVDPGPASSPKSATSGAAAGGGQSSSFRSPELNQLNPGSATVTAVGKADGAGEYYIGLNLRHGADPTNVQLAGVSAGAAIAAVDSDLNDDKLRIYKVTTTGSGNLVITLQDASAINVQATVWKTSGYTSAGLIPNSNNTGVAGGPQTVTLPGVPDAALILMVANRNGGGNPILVTVVSGTALDHNAQIGSTSRGAAGRFVKSGAGDLDVTIDWGAANGDEIMLAVALPVAP